MTSTNVDGLFIRANINRKKISEVHGNFFVDNCSRCGKSFIRNRPSRTMCCQSSDDNCPKCNFNLRDSVLDWNGNLHNRIWKQAEIVSRRADLAVCIGTSFLAHHINSLILEVKKTGKKMNSKKLAIINIQETELDNRANLLIRKHSDDVMKIICDKLSVQVDSYDPELDPTKNPNDLVPWNEPKVRQ